MPSAERRYCPPTPDPSSVVSAVEGVLFSLRGTVSCAVLNRKNMRGFQPRIFLLVPRPFQTRKAQLFGAKARFRVAAGSPCRDRYRFARSEKRALSSENPAVSLRILLYVIFSFMSETEEAVLRNSQKMRRIFGDRTAALGASGAEAVAIG